MVYPLERVPWSPNLEENINIFLRLLIPERRVGLDIHAQFGLSIDEPAHQRSQDISRHRDRTRYSKHATRVRPVSVHEFAGVAQSMEGFDTGIQVLAASVREQEPALPAPDKQQPQVFLQSRQ
jgi:hypothetical protein